jgi:Ca-activated chloride channel family protein
MGLAAMENFHFLHPAWLAALPVFWAFAAWRSLRIQRRGGWASVIDPTLLPALSLPGKGGGSPWWLLVAAWTMAVLALAGMTWERDQSVGYHAPSDWILVLDLSPSMAATDVSPDRATRARYVVSDFLNAAQDTRVGLVVFAGEAHTVAPLTTDVETVRALLPPLAPNIMPEPGDEVAPALDEASRLIHSAAGTRAQVVILTDGIVDPAHAMEAAQRLRSQGATVHVIGIGTQSGAPVPLKDGGFEQGPQGGSVLSKLPVDELKRIAAAGGGRYVAANDAGDLIDELKQQRSYRAREENPESPSQRVESWRNDGVWLLPMLLLSVALIARRGWL